MKKAVHMGRKSKSSLRKIFKWTMLSILSIFLILSFIGSCYVLAHPEKVAAYISIGQLVLAQEGETLSYQDALQRALQAGDDPASLEQAFQEYQAEPTIMSMLNLRSCTAPYHVSEKEQNNSVWLTIKSPYFGFNDFRWALKTMNVKKFLELNSQLFDSALRMDVQEYGMTYQVPAGFISGAEDWTTPVQCVKEYYDSINAPVKYMELIDGCGHYPQYEDTEAFCTSLRKMLEMLLSFDKS